MPVSLEHRLRVLRFQEQQKREMEAQKVIVGERERFLRELMRWDGVAATRELGPQTSQQQNSARQWCKKKGLVTFEDGYWRLTEIGRAAIRAA